MNYLIKYEGKDIKHARNDGGEKRVGPYPVDGYDGNTNTIYQFQGCYFHGHECRLTEKITDMNWRENREKKWNKTKKTTAYLIGKGYKVEEMWECEFDEFCKPRPVIHALGWEMRPAF